MSSVSRQNVERAHFDALAHTTGEIWWGSTTEAGIRRLERRAKLLKQNTAHYDNPKVLELGCGTGAFSKYILQELPDIFLTACDISPECIKVACERYGSYKNAKFLISDVTLDPLELSAFDVITGNSILHHLPIKNSLAYCYKLLKHGGSILFFEPNMMNPQVAVEKNIHFIGKMLQNTKNETAFFRWSLKKMLQEAGFEKISVIPFDFLHPAIPAKLIDFFDNLGDKIEGIPVLKEFSGSLLIAAAKI